MGVVIACILLVSMASIGVQSQKTSCNCGWVNKGRIVGGQEAQKNMYPMIAALETPSRFQFCAGTVLTPWHVVTAAHCTFDQSPSGVRVRVGAHNLKNSGDVYSVARILNHERYNDETASFDISLLVTASEIKFTQFVGPACLNNGPLDITGQQVTALGWGHTKDGGQASNVLREVQLKVISFDECSRQWKGKGPRRDNNVCTYEVRKDTCQGDSGGPLIWLDKNTGRYTLAALVSFGGECAGPLPGVNTDVSLFLGWINSKIASTKPGIAACRKM